MNEPACTHPNKVAADMREVLGFITHIDDRFWRCPDCGQLWVERPGAVPRRYVQIVRPDAILDRLESYPIANHSE